MSRADVTDRAALSPGAFDAPSARTSSSTVGSVGISTSGLALSTSRYLCASSEAVPWLEADKTLILNEALRYHRLDWHEVITHAFLPTSDRPCKSAKVQGGPWRYSKYVVRIFLITNGGVREASADLDFERAVWHLSERDNYRFEALSSVRVEISSRYSHTLNVTLTNGPTKSTVVSEAPSADGPGDEGRQEEDQVEAANINLEAAGFPHTLRVLESIAAEGKPWFDRQKSSSAFEVSDPPVTV